jgi:hypothetical protein
VRRSIGDSVAAEKSAVLIIQQARTEVKGEGASRGASGFEGAIGRSARLSASAAHQFCVDFPHCAARAAGESVTVARLPIRLLLAVTLLPALTRLAAQQPTGRVSEYQPDSAPPRSINLRGTVDVPLLSRSDRDRRPMVEVMIDGRGPYRFAIETGAREIDLSKALVDSLHLKRVGGPDEFPEYHLDSLNVGAATFADLPVGELPPGIGGFDGVLGLPLYQNLLLTIDYPAGRVRLSKGGLPAADGQSILSLTRVGPFWGIPVRIAGKAFDAVLDTQNSGAINIPPFLGDSLPFDGALQTIGRARGAFGTVDVKGGSLAGDVTIGKYTVPKPFLAIVPLPPEYPNHPNIGSQLLDSFVVTLDQRNGRLQLAHAGGVVITLPARRGSAQPAPGAAPSGPPLVK